MEVKVAHLFFEQSGTFKNAFREMGVEAYDYDIQNDYGQTDYVIDLFKEIEEAYRGGQSVFDKIGKDDLIMAFFPCIYFSGFNNPIAFSLKEKSRQKLCDADKIKIILERSQNREKFYELLIKFVGVCLSKGIRLIIENPYSPLSYLVNNFLLPPKIIDMNRRLRGDYFVKPTMYFFFNCDPENGFSSADNPEKRTILKTKSSKVAGICSKERSEISPVYARNFIKDFILGTGDNIFQMEIDY